MTTVHTIGHSNQPMERFIELLRQHEIATLADVRSRPFSRWAPHFQKKALAGFLAAEGLEYVFLGRELGGRPDGVEFYGPDGRVDCERRARAPDFRAGVEQLIELAGTRTTAILCAEEDPMQCHRRRLVAPALRGQGITVVHIRGDGRLQSEEELLELSDPSPQLRLF
jgi:uncharacterized protein (DUF488 family)